MLVLLFALLGIRLMRRYNKVVDSLWEVVPFAAERYFAKADFEPAPSVCCSLIVNHIVLTAVHCEKQNHIQRKISHRPIQPTSRITS